MAQQRLNPANRIYLALIGLFFVALIMLLPRLPNDTLTRPQMWFWAGLTSFLLFQLLCGVVQLFADGRSNQRKNRRQYW